jgi:hypothetical protein
MVAFEKNLFLFHYDDAVPPADDTTPADKEEKKVTLTQKEIDEIVTKRTEKARKAQKATLDELETIKGSLKMTEEQKEAFEAQLENARKAVSTADELRKRAEKKAADEYSAKVTNAEKAARTWEDRYRNLKINNEIQSAATQHGVMPTSIPFVEAFLGRTIKLEEQKGEDGSVKDHVAMVTFIDPQGSDGKPVEVNLSVADTIKRMKELPDVYGNLFQAPNGGGTGGHSGRPGGQPSKGYRKGMSQEEYMALRAKDREAALAE